MRLSQIPVGILFEGMENVEEGPVGREYNFQLKSRGVRNIQQHRDDTARGLRGDRRRHQKDPSYPKPRWDTKTATSFAKTDKQFQNVDDEIAKQNRGSNI